MSSADDRELQRLVAEEERETRKRRDAIQEILRARELLRCGDCGSRDDVDKYRGWGPLCWSCAVARTVQELRSTGFGRMVGASGGL